MWMSFSPPVQASRQPTGLLPAQAVAAVSITNISVIVRRWSASLNPCCRFVDFVFILLVKFDNLAAKLRINEQNAKQKTFFLITVAFRREIFQIIQNRTLSLYIIWQICQIWQISASQEALPKFYFRRKSTKKIRAHQTMSPNFLLVSVIF